MPTEREIAERLSCLYEQHASKVLATLVRLVGDFDLAEEAMQEAFVTAMESWTDDTLPSNPTSWLISTGRFKAIDILRRRARLRELQPELQRLAEEIEAHNEDWAQQDIEDDQLRLIFTCCHPSIDPSVQIPLTLREVCGLSTDEIASAFLVATPTMAQRIVRGKAKIRLAKIPFKVPELRELPQRLAAVLSVIYLVFSEGYAASCGDSATRVDLSREAIRLARLLHSLLPEPEVEGLLALMLLHESRRPARTDAQGDIVLLEDQDRSLWDQRLIAEGTQRVSQALRSGRFGSYTVQAAISAAHARAPSAAATDWHQIVDLYNTLAQLEPSPVIELNRAVAIAMRDGPTAGLAIVDALGNAGELSHYHLFHATRGELLRRAGQSSAAAAALEQALALARQEPEKRLLRRKLETLRVCGKT